eukprot:51216-Rhodomonas_salina.1
MTFAEAKWLSEGYHKKKQAESSTGLCLVRREDDKKTETFTTTIEGGVNKEQTATVVPFLRRLRLE